MIVKDSITTYTFEVTTNEKLDNSEFYNLVVAINNNTQNIDESYFLKYNPSDLWLEDNTQQFSDDITLITNDYFDTNNLFSKNSQDCVTGASWQWECYDGNMHSPGTSRDECYQTVFFFVLTLEYGTCTETASLNMPPDGSSGGSAVTNSGSSGNGDGVDDGSGGAKLPTSPISGEKKVDPNAFECSLSDETFNALYSSNSTFNVDLSDVRPTCDDNIDISKVEANEKFMCIYKKLGSSQKFRSLFLDSFGESEDINVKIADDLPENILGMTTVPEPFYRDPVTGEITNFNVLIKLNKSQLMSNSAIATAVVILHESLHAYLKLKYHGGCNQSARFDDLDDTVFTELLHQYYSECDISQGDHEFMFNYMVPTITEILESLKEDLIPSSHQTAAEQQYSFINETNPTISDGNYLYNVPWNWNEFYNYMSMLGLNNSSAFHFAYPNNYHL